MPKDIIKGVQTNIEEAEAALKVSEELIKRLKLAGEDVSAIEAEHRLAKTRVAKWKRAFKD